MEATRERRDVRPCRVDLGMWVDCGPACALFRAHETPLSNDLGVEAQAVRFY